MRRKDEKCARGFIDDQRINTLRIKRHGECCLRRDFSARGKRLENSTTLAHTDIHHDRNCYVRCNLWQCASREKIIKDYNAPGYLGRDPGIVQRHEMLRSFLRYTNNNNISRNAIDRAIITQPACHRASYE